MINEKREEKLDGRTVLDRTEAFMADTLTIRRKKEVMPTMLTRLAIPEGCVKTVQDLERYIHDRTQVSEDEKSLSFEHGDLTIRIFQSAGGGWRISSATARSRRWAAACSRVPVPLRVNSSRSSLCRAFAAHAGPRRQR